MGIIVLETSFHYMEKSMNKKFLVVLCVLINAIYMNAKAENFDYKVISEEKEIKIIVDEKYAKYNIILNKTFYKI